MQFNEQISLFALRCFLSPLVGPTFSAIFPCSTLRKISENGRFRCPCKISNNWALRALLEPPFAPECCPMFAPYAQTNEQITPFALRIFSRSFVRPTFYAIFPWSPLSKISENGRFRFPCKISHNWALRALLEPPFAPECCPMFALDAETNEQITPFALKCFSSLVVRPTFSAICPWSPFSKISENGRFRFPCKISHNWALRALLQPPLAPECCPIVALKMQSNEQITFSALRCFSSPLVRPTSSAIFPWSPLNKISDNGRFRCPCKISNNWALRALLEPPVALECCPMFALYVQTNEQIARFVLRCFWNP